MLRRLAGRCAGRSCLEPGPRGRRAGAGARAAAGRDRRAQPHVAQRRARGQAAAERQVRGRPSRPDRRRGHEGRLRVPQLVAVAGRAARRSGGQLRARRRLHRRHLQPGRAPGVRLHQVPRGQLPRRGRAGDRARHARLQGRRAEHQSGVLHRIGRGQQRHRGHAAWRHLALSTSPIRSAPVPLAENFGDVDLARTTTSIRAASSAPSTTTTASSRGRTATRAFAVATDNFGNLSCRQRRRHLRDHQPARSACCINEFDLRDELADRRLSATTRSCTTWSSRRSTGHTMLLPTGTGATSSSTSADRSANPVVLGDHGLPGNDPLFPAFSPPRATPTRRSSARQPASSWRPTRSSPLSARL